MVFWHFKNVFNKMGVVKASSNTSVPSSSSVVAEIIKARDQIQKSLAAVSAYLTILSCQNIIPVCTAILKTKNVYGSMNGNSCGIKCPSI